MGGDIGGHAHGNAASAVDQHIGIAGRQNCGLRIFAIIIELKINCIFVDIGQERLRRFFHTHFCVAIGRGLIAIHGAKIALPVQQHQGH